MQIHLVAIGKRMPNWVTDGYQNYAKRLPPDYQCRLIELEAKKRTKSTDIQRCLDEEGELLLQAIPPDHLIIALDRQGKTLNTPALAKHLHTWHDQAQSISILIGGPEGIADNVLQRAHHRWSLSALTLPHPLVRVVISEQLYRAWSIITNHPYHR